MLERKKSYTFLRLNWDYSCEKCSCKAGLNKAGKWINGWINTQLAGGFEVILCSQLSIKSYIQITNYHAVYTCTVLLTLTFICWHRVLKYQIYTILSKYEDSLRLWDTLSLTNNYIYSIKRIVRYSMWELTPVFRLVLCICKELGPSKIGRKP